MLITQTIRRDYWVHMFHNFPHQMGIGKPGKCLKLKFEDIECRDGNPSRHGTARHGTARALPCRAVSQNFFTARHVPRGTRATIFSHHFIKFCIINISSFPILWELYGPILSIYINLSIIIYKLVIIIFFTPNNGFYTFKGFKLNGLTLIQG